MKIIINADDFGKNKIVNQAIIKEIGDGNVTSTTIIANAEAFDEAIEFAKNNPNISYGVHLTLDEFKPVLPAEAFANSGIIDNNGQFIKGAIFTKKIYSLLSDVIYKEWLAQIQKITETGVQISHLDSHHHVHTIPALQGILVRILNELNLHCIRTCDYQSLKRILHGYKHFRKTNYLKEYIYLFLKIGKIWRCANWIKSLPSSIKHTDEFCSCKSFIQNKKYFENYCQNSFIEIECHPGHPMYEDETKDLKLLKNYETISYNNFRL